MLHLCTSAPLHFYTSALLLLCTSKPKHLYTYAASLHFSAPLTTLQISAPLHLNIFTPMLHLCISTLHSLDLCTSAPPHLYTSIYAASHLHLLSASLTLCLSDSLHLCISAPLHLCTCFTHIHIFNPASSLHLCFRCTCTSAPMTMINL